MEQLLKRQVGKSAPEDVTELFLDRTKQVNLELLRPYTNLFTLTMNACQLSDVKCLPQLAELDMLGLNDNSLKGADLVTIAASCPNLKSLQLSKNGIESADELKPLAALTKLKEITLFGNPICDKEEDYRAKVFGLLSSLELVDDADRDGKEVEDVEDMDSLSEEEEDDEDDVDYDELDEESQRSAKEELHNLVSVEQKEDEADDSFKHAAANLSAGQIEVQGEIEVETAESTEKGGESRKRDTPGEKNDNDMAMKNLSQSPMTKQ